MPTERDPTGRAAARARLFPLGCVAVTAGVLLHLPMFVGARGPRRLLVGMPLDPPMVAGMVLIGAGLLIATAALLPPRAFRRGVPVQVRIHPLDQVTLGRPHLALMAVLTLAIAVDSQKPFTFAFILPGVASEYGLASPARAAPGHLAVGLLPLAGIVGTVLGSLIWGLVADRVGRRAAILVAALLFVATAICGAMPAFSLNLVMCFLMGLGVGGLLPISFALLTETIPARHRGQVVVLVAGVGTGLGFLLTSGLATWLIPGLGWRVMWLLGLPTGLLLVALNRWIPESPRFLAATGRTPEAVAQMRRFGVRVLAVDLTQGADPLRDAPPTAAADGRQRSAPRLAALTTALVLYGLAWGVVNFGFLTWLPTDLAGRLGVTAVSGILTNAALFSLPGALGVSWLYGRWSSRGTMVLVALLTAAALGGFALAGEGVSRHPGLLTALLVCLLVSLWGVIAVLAPYSAEVYPTRRRGGGAGLAAAASKFGGVLALAMGVAGLAPPSLAGAALLAAAAMLVAALAVGRFGIETRQRRLEEILDTGATRSVPLTSTGGRA